MFVQGIFLAVLSVICCTEPTPEPVMVQYEGVDIDGEYKLRQLVNSDDLGTDNFLFFSKVDLTNLIHVGDVVLWCLIKLEARVKKSESAWKTLTPDLKDFAELYLSKVYSYCLSAQDMMRFYLLSADDLKTLQVMEEVAQKTKILLHRLYTKQDDAEDSDEYEYPEYQ